MADIIDHNIRGDDMQIVEITLDPTEGVLAEAGAMMYMLDGIEMQTSAKGGFKKSLFRTFAGESFFITTFVNNGDSKSKVAFAAPYPGKIIVLELDKLGGTFLCQRDAFLCAANGTEIEVAFTKKFGAGFFGGEGFILQRLKGNGKAFIHAGGTIIKIELSSSMTIRVDTGCLVALAPTVDYDIKFVGGFKNALFGGEGIFLAKLRGPGIIYLPSLPFSRMADRIYAAAGSMRVGEQSTVTGNVLGAGAKILGGLMGLKK